MRRLILAILATVLVTGGVATLTQAQLAQTTGVPDVPGAGAGEPIRNARYLLRNGLDYLRYEEYERALAFLTQAQAQQIELNTTERAQLTKGMELARSKMRELAAKPKAPAPAPEKPAIRPSDGHGALVSGESLEVPPPVEIPPLMEPGALTTEEMPQPAPLSADALATDQLLPKADQQVPQGALDNLPPAPAPQPVIREDGQDAEPAPPAPLPIEDAPPAHADAEDTAIVVPSETPGPLTIDLSNSAFATTAKVAKRRSMPEAPPLEVGSRKRRTSAPVDEIQLAQNELPIPADAPAPGAAGLPPLPADPADGSEGAALPPLPLELTDAPAPVVVPDDPAPAPEEAAVPVPAPEETRARPAAPRRDAGIIPPPPSTGNLPHLPADIQRDVDKIARRQRTEVESAQPEAARPLPAPTDSIGDGGGMGSQNLVVPRAPSPTEPQPLRSIPAPEEFTRLPKRDFKPYRKLWAAPGTCHTTLYFQDPVLERYGQPMEDKLGRVGKFLSYPIDDPTQTNQRQSIAQPFFSFGLLGFQIATMPYKLIVDPPWEAEYDLGYWRPGDRTPRNLYYFPLTGVGPPGAGSNYR